MDDLLKTKRQLIKELEEFRKNIHHFKCVECGRRIAVYSKGLGDIEISKNIKKRLTIGTKKIYLEGLCQRCEVSKLKQKIADLKSLAAERLQENEEKYGQLVSTASDAIMIFDTETKQFLEVNKACEDIYGYSKREFLNLKHNDITAEPEKSEDSFKELLEGKLKRIPLRYHRKKDGTIFPVEISASFFKLQHRKVFCGIIRDISERIRAEMALKKSEQKFKDLAQSLKEVVYCVDPNTLIATYVNPVIKEIYGYPAEDWLKIPNLWMDTIHPDDKKRIFMKLKHSQRNMENGIIEYRIINKDNEIRWVENRYSWEKNPEGEVISLNGVVYDITERKGAEENIRKAMRMKSEFTSMVSHELRTPLTIIKESIAIVLSDAAEIINIEQKDFLDTAKKNVDRLARLINDILDFQKLESGRMRFNVGENDINEIVREVQKEMLPLARKKKLNFIVRLSKKSSKAKFDRDKIIQVLMNVVDNALKFTEEGNIIIAAGRDNKDNAIHVSVKDTGQGIREEDLPKLFHRFEQLTDRGGEKIGGTGLGLMISKEIIERHSGKIWIESEFGKGTTLHFVLPINERS